MIPALFRNTFRDGATLDPVALQENLEDLRHVADEITAKRFTHSDIVFVLDNKSDVDDPEVRTFYVYAPYAFEIVAREMVVYGTDGKTVTLTSDATGWVDLTAEADGATTKVYSADARSVLIPANTLTYFRVTLPSSTTLNRCTVILKCRHDRHAGNPPSTASISARIDGSVDDAAANLNTPLSAYATWKTSNDTNNKRQRITIYDVTPASNSFASYEDTFQIPSFGGTVKQLEIQSVQEGLSPNVTATLKDEGGTTVASVSVTSDDPNATGITRLHPGDVRSRDHF